MVVNRRSCTFQTVQNANSDRTLPSIGAKFRSKDRSNFLSAWGGDVGILIVANLHLELIEVSKCEGNVLHDTTLAKVIVGGASVM